MTDRPSLDSPLSRDFKLLTSTGPISRLQLRGMPLSNVPDEILLEIVSHLDMLSKISLSQTFHAARNLSRITSLWWTTSDLPLAHLKSTKPIEDYTPHDLYSAALHARRATTYLGNVRLSNITPRETGKVKPIRVRMPEDSYAETVAPGSPYLFYLSRPSHAPSQPIIFCHDLSTGNVCGSWQLSPLNLQKSGPSNNLTLLDTSCLSAVALSHTLIRLSILTKTSEAWSAPVLRIVDVSFRDTTDGKMATFELRLEKQTNAGSEPAEESDETSSRIVRKKLGRTHAPVSRLQNTLQLPKLTYSYLYYPRWYHTEPDVVCWIQDVKITKEDSVIAPLLTVVSYKLGSGTDSPRVKIGKWTCKRDVDNALLSARLCTTTFAGHMSLDALCDLPYTIIIIANEMKPEVHAVQLSDILSSEKTPEGIWSGTASTTIGGQTVLPRPSPRNTYRSQVSPERNLWVSSDNSNERMLYGARITFDSHVECINPAAAPDFGVRYMAERRVEGTEAYSYHLRVLVVTSTRYTKDIADVWWYDLFFRVLVSRSFDAENGSVGTETSLYIPPPKSDSHYDRYVVSFGLERGVAWFTTMGSPSFLFLETEPPGPSQQSEDGDYEEKRIKSWRALTSHGSEIGHVDLRAGVACCFSNRLMDGDESTYMDIFWFRQ